MKPIDHKLDRLLTAAAQAPQRPLDGPPFGLETRVMAQWRAARGEDESAFLFAFFQRAVVAAGVALLLSAAWSLTRPSGDATADEVVVSNYELQAGLNP
jgi:hypothetical protein